MKIYDNIQEIVKDDMVTTISKGSKVSIAAACFSMYAYKELKNSLILLTSSVSFLPLRPLQRRRLPRQSANSIFRVSRETSLYGTEFEIKLRNEMTQKAIARECAD